MLASGLLQQAEPTGIDRHAFSLDLLCIYRYLHCYRMQELINCCTTDIQSMLHCASVTVAQPLRAYVGCAVCSWLSTPNVSCARHAACLQVCTQDYTPISFDGGKPALSFSGC